MGFLFNRKKTAPEPEVIEKVEVVEKEVYSRFTFAHDEDLVVKSFKFKNDSTAQYSDLCAGTVFTPKAIVNAVDGKLIYYIFRLPNELPATRLVTPKKVLCLGVVVVNDCTGEIEDIIHNDWVGVSLECFINQGLFNATDFTMDSNVIVMNRANVIEEVTNVDELIDYDTFVRSVVIEASLESVTEDD